jgi:hypothetical protein
MTARHVACVPHIFDPDRNAMQRARGIVKGEGVDRRPGRPGDRPTSFTDRPALIFSGVGSGACGAIASAVRAKLPGAKGWRGAA